MALHDGDGVGTVSLENDVGEQVETVLLFVVLIVHCSLFVQSLSSWDEDDEYEPEDEIMFLASI